MYRIENKIVDRDQPEKQEIFGIETIVLERSRLPVFRTENGQPRDAKTKKEKAQLEKAKEILKIQGIERIKHARINMRLR